MRSDWLVFCDCCFQCLCPLMEKDKRLMEGSWRERLTEGETGSCSDGQGHAQFSSVQSLSRVRLFATPWTAAHQASLSITNSRTLLKLMSIMWVMPSNQPSHPLLSLSPSTFNLSQHQGLFQWVGSLHQVAKVLEFQLQRQSFQWIFRTDFL